MINDFQIISKEKELDKQLLFLLILSLLLFIVPFFRSVAFVILGFIVIYFLWRFDFIKTKISIAKNFRKTCPDNWTSFLLKMF